MDNSPLLAFIENMRRDDVIAKRKETEPVLRGFGVAALYLFGSHARDEAGSNSDVDVFIDVAPGAAFGLRRYMGAFETLKQAVGENVDYGTRNGLHPLLRSDIEREAIRIF
jgi:predicted nucleotidyltransferase